MAPAPPSGFETRRLRRFDHAFAIATRLVSFEEFERFDPNKETYRHRYDVDCTAPVMRVTRQETIDYCEWLTEQVKPSPASPPGEYRLPTEDEWEHACRAGTKTSRPHGDDRVLLAKYAWYVQNTIEEKVQPVARLRPNPLGLFDMLGNAWEWCLDRWKADPTDRVTDEQNVANLTIGQDDHGVIRGGSFNDGARLVRAARRSTDVAAFHGNDLGFRVSRTYT